MKYNCSILKKKRRKKRPRKKKKRKKPKKPKKLSFKTHINMNLCQRK